MDIFQTYEQRVGQARFIQKLVHEEGDLSSPIDLNISNMTVAELNPLLWCNYDIPPKKLKLTNTGHTVILSAKWQQERAYLTDGPFLSKFVFSQIHFHWGINDMEGSEHRFDGASSPMELHAVHFKSEYRSQELAVSETDGVAVLVYAFKLQTDPNPELDDIVGNIPFIKNPNSSIRLNPWLITKILRPFTRDYFVYWGSVPLLNRTHTVLWLISREPIGISPQQVAEFRTLYDQKYKPLSKNCRSLQELQKRHVFHANPSGSLYATLLPIPREPPNLMTGRAATVEEYLANR
ncbi:carbonic anhydrase 2-like [Belonocnema kinseyi]|uniref:carbonic anhydrase 2-like n=1 Tax=Belonocnema kinseyi TaxID=2817044 RepID=UPI00143DCFE2|nr:carbonic anhydrase 2-like [Belonocnema kinseyi]